ncbi:MAG TPA: tetratricopeptide repeat protein [Anaerolineales bacterium]|nr:tetratricopeptide repeat protein [Anaerolineales bacterium]
MSGRKDLFQQAMHQGHSAAWDQDWEQAATCYRQALQEFPDHPVALTSLGLALFELEQFSEALPYYSRAAELSPDEPLPLEKIAQIGEHLNQVQYSTKAALRAAELYLARGEVDRAIANLTQVTRLDEKNLAAHSRLALIYDRRGSKPQAVTEYLIVASFLQHKGEVEKAIQAVNHALQLLPQSREAQQSLVMLKEGKLLPKPIRSPRVTSQLQKAPPPSSPEQRPTEQAISEKDPIQEAREKALATLAEIVLSQMEDEQPSEPYRGLQALMHGTPKHLFSKPSSQEKILQHLSLAVDLQSHQQEEKAVEELERAIDAGLDTPAAYFDLGLIRLRGERLESALRYLNRAAEHVDFALAAHLLLGQAFRKTDRMHEAAIEYMEALKWADAQVVPPDQADELMQLYEPLVEAEAQQSDLEAKGRLYDSIDGLLVRTDWREHMAQARKELQADIKGAPPIPLGELLSQARSGRIVEAIMLIHKFARLGYERSAMEEAFFTLQYAPTFLPLHIYMGELLLQQDRLPEAIEKFTVIADAYSARGEVPRAMQILRRIIRAAPMEQAARQHLISLLNASGQVVEAIQEYQHLAGVYYNLADLSRSREAYMEALRLANQSKQYPVLIVQILHRIADIDLQCMDWREALRVYEQIRTLQPDDQRARINLIELNLRLMQVTQAQAELANYLNYMASAGQMGDAIPFLEGLAAENPDQLFIHRYLEEAHRQVERKT